MRYTIHTFEQGSPEWIAHRSACYNASDLVIAMGISGSRIKLIQRLIGIEPEIDAATQRRFNDGHRYEMLARPIAEKILGGRKLYPVTVSIAINGLSRRLSASLDGVTDDYTINFEHKMLNINLSAALNRGIIPKIYWPQLEQGMLINGASRTLFIVSKWDEKDNLIEKKHCWYESQRGLHSKIIETWRQLEKDIASYRHVEAKPSIVATNIEHLPALKVEISGRVITSNLVNWREIVLARVEAINTDLQSDDDFALAEKTVIFLADGEKRLDMVKSAVQAQAVDIDAVFQAIDQLREKMRNKRLSLDKLVKARKESIRMEIVLAAKADLCTHVEEQNKRIGWWNGRPLITSEAADFAGVIRGKKTIAGLRDACNAELTRTKIAINEIANRIETNRKAMSDHIALFPDFAHVCTKEPDDFSNLIAVRVEAERKARVEAERKARVEAERVEAERVEAERKIRVEAERVEAERKACLAGRQARIEAERVEAERVEAEQKACLPPCLPPCLPAGRAGRAGRARQAHVIEETLEDADADVSALWFQVKADVIARLDSLSIDDLRAVADYIDHKAWK